MTFEPPSLPPAGWYPDPELPGRQRWWDGASWAAPIGSPPPGDRYPDVGALLGGAFSLALRHWRALVLLAVVTSVPASLLVGFALRHVLTDVVVEGDEVTGWDSSRLAPGLVMVSVAALIGLFGYLATAWLMLHSVDRRNDAPTGASGEWALARTSLAAALRASARAIGWFVAVVVALGVVVLLVVVLTIVVPVFGILAMVALAPVGVWLAIRWTFVLHAVVDGPGNPFRRSARTVAGRWWATLGRFLLVAIITAILGFVVSTATSAFSGDPFAGQFGDQAEIELAPDGSVERIDLGAIAPSPLEMLLGVVATLIGAVFTTGVPSAAWAAMYRTRHPARTPG